MLLVFFKNPTLKDVSENIHLNWTELKPSVSDRPVRDNFVSQILRLFNL